MNNKQFALNKIFACIFCLGFLWVFVTFFTRESIYRHFNSIIIVFGMLAFVALYFILFKLGYGLRSSSPRFTLYTLLFFLAGIYLMLQLVFARELYTYMGQSWDFGIVTSAAMKYVVHDMPIDRYFNMFPNNIPLLLLFIAIFKPAYALGITNFTDIGIFMNLVSLNVSLLLVFLTVKKIKGSRTAAVVSIIAMMITLPLLAYMAIYYTDTLTLIYPILSLYLWLCAKENLQSGKNKKAFIQIGFAALSAVAGGLLKISVLIVLIAIVVDAFISLKINKKSLIAVGLVAVLFFAVYLPSYQAIMNAPILPEKNIEDQIPWTHWVMMGLQGNGNYYDPDYKMTIAIPGDERGDFIKQEIAQRIKDYGFFGMFDHLTEKNAFVWNDGTYYTALKVMRDRVGPSSLDKYIIYEGEYFALYGYYCQALMMTTVVGFILAAWYMFRKKEFASVMLPFALCIFGLYVFQMLWEARSRYLLNFVPVFIVVYICSYENLFHDFNSLVSKIKLKIKKPATK